MEVVSLNELCLTALNRPRSICVSGDDFPVSVFCRLQDGPVRQQAAGSGSVGWSGWRQFGCGVLPRH